LRPKDTIVAPAKGSEQVTTTASKAPPKDKEDKEIKAFNAYLIDNYNSID
jgi:hypothetical protein